MLAINEALANSAEFAYLQAGVAGTMDLQAWHDAADSTITVVVVGRRRRGGRSESQADTRSRGRGIPLMRALSDRPSIETSTGGTQVKLEWTNVGAPLAP